MLIWGGYSTEADEKRLAMFGHPQGGAAFNPATRQWRKIPLAPISGRSFPMTVWTGHEMMTYGGFEYEAMAAHGAAYDPATNRWRRLPDPKRVELYGAVEAWDGKRFLLWGGRAGDSYAPGTYFADGLAYDPASNKWSSIPRAPLEARSSACGVWTGKGLIVWGGFGESVFRGTYSSSEEFRDGAIYTPATGRWKKIARSPLSTRGGCVASWTGSQMLVFGGTSLRREPRTYFMDGALYDPVTDTWTRIPKTRIAPRHFSATVWTGTKFVVWGGTSSRTTPDGEEQYFNDGAAFDVRTGRWNKLPRSPLKPRAHPAAAWTGSGILFWGGSGPQGRMGQFSDGASLVLD